MTCLNVVLLVEVLYYKLKLKLIFAVFRKKIWGETIFRKPLIKTQS